MTVHFDVDPYIHDLLTGDRRSCSITPETISTIADASSISICSIKSQSRITPQVLEALPNLMRIVTRTVGTDHIDMDACKKRGIVVKKHS